MDGHVRKMMIKLKIPSEMAQALWEAGFQDYKQVRRAKQSDLEKVAGIGPATAKKLKGE